MMRIIAIRVRPVCIAFSCLYAVVGLLSFIQYCFLNGIQQFTFPFGIIGPFIYLTFNLKIPRSMTASAPVPYAIAAVFVYALSGCITGFVGTYLFNLIAHLMGGIDARFVKTADDQTQSTLDRGRST
jgi:hypothetical protein